MQVSIIQSFYPPTGSILFKAFEHDACKLLGAMISMTSKAPVVCLTLNIYYNSRFLRFTRYLGMSNQDV